MVFAGLFRVVRRMVEVTFRDVGVMASLFMVSGRMVLGGEVVMLGGMLVVLDCLAMVFGGVFRHGNAPDGDVVVLSGSDLHTAYSRLVTVL